MRHVYIYDTPESRAKGLIKIGDAVDVERRIREQLNTASSFDAKHLEFEVLYEAPAVRLDGTHFRDHDVHAALAAKGFSKRQIRDGGQVLKGTTEWFEVPLKKAVHLIEQLKAGRRIEEIDINRHENFSMRPEQHDAVVKTRAYFAERKSGTPEMLWNAKMRFGKTFTAYQLAREMNFSKVLVLTYKPAVEDSWQDDLESHVDFKNYLFLTRESLNNIQHHIDAGRNIVAFASYQDLLGKGADGGDIKSRHIQLFNCQWDLVIVDEFHYGAGTKKAKGLLADIVDAQQGKKNEFEEPRHEPYSEEDEDADEQEGSEIVDELAKQASSKYRLYLSGTPFKALADNRFELEAIYNWSYVDEQRAKAKWDIDNPGRREENPYIGLPVIQLYLYKVSKDLIESGKRENKDEFSLNYFFRANSHNKFVNEAAVRKWLDLISGVIVPHREIEDEIWEERAILDSQYPFDHRGALCKDLNHTVWYLSRVNSAYALMEMLEQHPIFQQYKIILVAGNAYGSGRSAVELVRKTIRGNPRTITLTVGKLTTGVNIPEWKGMMFLLSLEAPEKYFQAAFRAQTPYIDPVRRQRKEKCYIFDFSPNRSLRLLTAYSEKLSPDTVQDNSERKIKEFIRYLPVLKVAGNRMVELDARDVLNFDLSGVDAKGLGGRFVDRTNMVVNGQTIAAINASIDSQQRCQEIFQRIKMFRKWNGASGKEMRSCDASVADLDVNDKTIKELKTKDVSSELEEKKRVKDLEKAHDNQESELEKVRELLKTLLSRIPIFMYLTDATEENLEQVLIETQNDLFRKATGIDIEDFRYLISLGLLKVDSLDGYILRFLQLENQNFQLLNRFDIVDSETHLVS